MERDLGDLSIQRSDHPPDDGMSIMEMVAYVAGEPVTSRPACVSPVLREWMLAWADCLDDDIRQELRSYVAPLTSSRAASEVETDRRWLVIDWLLRVSAPIWLQGAGRYNDADRLIALSAMMAPRDLALARASTEMCAEAAHAAEMRAWTSAADVAQADQTADGGEAAPCSPLGGLSNEPVPDRRAWPETWGAIADAALSVIEGAATLTSAASRASGYATTAPADLTPAWTAATATVVHASAAIAWRGVGTLISDKSWSWDISPDQAWRAGVAAARSALRPVERATHESAHRLVRAILRLG